MKVRVIETLTEEYEFKEGDMPSDVINSLKDGDTDAFEDWFCNLTLAEVEDRREGGQDIIDRQIEIEPERATI